MTKSSIFDMIGPVMIGPSSSHTAGVVRIGRVGVQLLGDIPDEAEITFYNSFAKTYEGHGSDRAIIAGLLDFHTDDIRIRTSFDEAKGKLKYSFKTVGNASTKHPNTVALKLKKGDKQVTMQGESLGGGVIQISKFNDFNASFSAGLHTLIITADDTPGSIAFLTSVISHDDCNIANMTVSRKGKNDLACQILEMDSGLEEITLQYMQNLKWVHEVIYVPVI